jgi:hypothetical protein
MFKNAEKETRNYPVTVRIKEVLYCIWLFM